MALAIYISFVAIAAAVSAVALWAGLLVFGLAWVVRHRHELRSYVPVLPTIG
jgi:hypothetical protein